MLNNIRIRDASPKSKPCKMADGGGLYLLISPNESRPRRLKCRHLGKGKLFSFVPHPDLGLAQARQERDSARIARGVL